MAVLESPFPFFLLLQHRCVVIVPDLHVDEPVFDYVQK
jgi:hypothetical protein